MDKQYIPLSYISQYNYCKRRAGLLMLEQQWSESTDTVKGREEHKNVHNASIERKGNAYSIHEMTVISEQLCLFGKCDIVEAYETNDGIILPFLDDKRYSLYPIEFKHGRLRREVEYDRIHCMSV